MLLGELVKAVGLRGEVKLHPSADFWDEALASRQLQLSTASGRRAVSVEAARRHGARMRVLRLGGVEDRGAAEDLVGAHLVLPLEALDVPLPPAPRPFQVRGLRVLLPDGTLLGRVEEVLPMPAQDVFVVRGGGREYLIPDAPAIVREVDLESGLMRVEPPPGLLEL